MGRKAVKKFIILTVTLVDRDDGGLSVSSDDLPGLIMSGSDKDKVAKAIAPAIRAIFEHRGFRNVVVHHGTPPSEILKKESPRNLDVHVEHSSTGVQTEQFVVELSAAAA